MTEDLWNERRAHLQTKMQLYQAQMAVVEASFREAQRKLMEMGDKWEPEPQNETA